MNNRPGTGPVGQASPSEPSSHEKYSSAAPPENLQHLAEPRDANIRIDNVNRSMWQYVKQHKLGELALVAPLAIAWEILAIMLLVKYLSSSAVSHNSAGGRSFGYLIALPIILFSSWIYRMRKQFEDTFLEEFAQANGYTFDKTGTVDKTYGTIFRLNGSQKVSDVVNGAYDGNALRLFLYELTVGAGQYKKRYSDTVIELDLHGQLPNMLLVNKHSKYGQANLTSAFGIKSTLALEGDFNQYFTLYAPTGNEMEALEIFSPDTMALMEDESKHYTVEFAGNRIYIYANGFITTTEQLTQVFALAKQLTGKIAPLASRLQNDSSLVTAPVNLTSSRKPAWLSRRAYWAVMAAVIVVCFGAGILAAPRQPQSSSSAANQVSNEFIADLQQNNSEAAFSLEAPHYQQIRSQQLELQLPLVYVPSGSPKIVHSSETSINSQQPTSDVVYEFSGSKPLYIRISLEENNGTWQVYGFDSADTPL